jgi:hypothetical protein
MFALRQWAGGWVLDLSAVGAGGPAPVGALPAASLPLLAAVLGGFFELDNTGAPAKGADESKKSPPASQAQRKRVASQGSNGKSKPAAVEVESDEAEEVASRSAKR